jgi:glycosyltransferase involved in cell wall biosynthesis
MANVDLHVHSKYSNHPSEWFLQRLGASESYTEPETIYQTARQRGMDFVTVTDHNRIEASLELVHKYPERCFSGVEVTAYFPEDNCKVHILIYGLSRDQFARIQKLRLNIYQLRDYLCDQDLACVVAHATYAVNNLLTLEHLEKLILLFNNFEGRNGSRSILHNDVLSRVLLGLTEFDFERLVLRHGIEPWGEQPWRKGLSGGSDDHAGLFIGKTSTEAEAISPQAFLEQIKQQRIQPQGRQNDFQGLTFTLYKIALDFSQHRSNVFSQSTLSDLTQHLFSDKRLSFKDRLRINKMKSNKNNAIYQSIVRLIETSKQLDLDDIDSRMDLLYDCIADISDQYFRSLLESLNSDMEELDIMQLVQGVSSSIPGIFLSMPFFSAFKHMFADRQLINALNLSLGKEPCSGQKKILWLTDTLTDLNGVSMTLQTIARLAEEKDYAIHVLSSLSEEQESINLPQTTLNIPPLYSCQLPHYEDLKINVPSVLRMLKEVYTEDPDEIYISTPGPVGLLGLLIGRMLGVPVKGIYHTDFTSESEAIIAEPAMSKIIEQYSIWFHNQLDTLLVPTSEYIQLLKERGYRHRHMQLFRRGLRTEHFKPGLKVVANDRLAPRLFYAGRVSKDKNIDFLIQAYRQVRELHPGVSLTIAGSGPYLADLQSSCSDMADVHFLGRVEYADLPQLYNEHDLFVFPSITETFGMVVLEAQACGIPALVSDVGGPKEIIVDGATGYALPVDRVQPWVARLDELLHDLAAGGMLCRQLGEAARMRVVKRFSWDSILADMTRQDSASLKPSPRQRQHESIKRLFKLAANMLVN